MNIDFLMKLLGMPQSLEDLRIEHLPGLLNGDYDYLFILRNNRKSDIKVVLNKARRVEAEFVEEIPNPHKILPEHIESLATMSKSLAKYDLEYHNEYIKADLELKRVRDRLTLEEIVKLYTRTLPIPMNKLD